MNNATFLEQLINLFAPEELEKIFEKDEEYQKRLNAEDLLYQKLNEELTNEQAGNLEQYFIAANETAARREILSYIQGMKDLLSLLKDLS